MYSPQDESLGLSWNLVKQHFFYISPMNLSLTDFPLPVRLRTEVPLTDDELLRFCEDNELLRVERDSNGELTVMSPTGTEDGFVESEVALELGIWARQDGRGRMLNSNTGVRLSDASIRAADAAWVSWSLLNSLSSDQRKGYALFCPEFVIEVRSESDGLSVVRQRMEMWLANGAELAWLIDPSRKVVDIYRVGEETEIHEGPTSVQGTGPVRGFELVLARIWG